MQSKLLLDVCPENAAREPIPIEQSSIANFITRCEVESRQRARRDALSSVGSLKLPICDRFEFSLSSGRPARPSREIRGHVRRDRNVSTKILCNGRGHFPGQTKIAKCISKRNRFVNALRCRLHGILLKRRCFAESQPNGD